MNNKIDYLIHKTYDPAYYHRQYEQDLPKEESITSRTAQIVLPFIGLYRPFGAILGLQMGGIRVLSHSMSLFGSENWGQAAIRTGQVAFAILAFLGSVYHFSLGLMISTLVDVVGNASSFFAAAARGEFAQSVEELMQGVGSSLYLAMLFTGALEIMVASLLFQASLSLFQARNELVQGRIPEVLAKTAMGMIRFSQAHGQYQLIQRRDELFARYAELRKVFEEARNVEHLIDSDLHKLSKDSVVIDGVDFGAHFHGYGEGYVKGMNVCFRETEEGVVLDFKLNHVHRADLNRVLEKLADMDKKDLRELAKFCGSHATNLSLNMREDFWYEEILEIHLEGLGKITIYLDDEIVGLYNRVKVEMNRGKTLYDFHEALAFLQLDRALRESAEEDIRRMKIGHLFRTFYPKEALDFERSRDFFDLDIEAFENRVKDLCPEMGEIFEKYFSQMELEEILPGRMRYRFHGLADVLREMGANHLTAAITGSWWSEEEIFNRIAGILEMGMLSHEMREDASIQSKGLNGFFSYLTGGSDSVFTQIVTDKLQSYDELMYSFFGSVRINFELEALETGSYQYHDDLLGTRELDDFWLGWEYKNRDGILDFVRKEASRVYPANELMIKDRIPPKWIREILVKDEATRTRLIDYLRGRGLVQKDAMGRETILSRSLDSFIQTFH